MRVESEGSAKSIVDRSSPASSLRPLLIKISLSDVSVLLCLTMPCVRGHTPFSVRLLWMRDIHICCRGANSGSARPSMRVPFASTFALSSLISNDVRCRRWRSVVVRSVTPALETLLCESDNLSVRSSAKRVSAFARSLMS